MLNRVIFQNSCFEFSEIWVGCWRSLPVYFLGTASYILPLMIRRAIFLSLEQCRILDKWRLVPLIFLGGIELYTSLVLKVNQSDATKLLLKNWFPWILLYVSAGG